MPELKAAIIPVTPFQQNCTLIWDEESKTGAVVDPGGDVDRIAQAIDELKLNVEKILLTHGHIDHAGGADELRERLGVEIFGPQREDQWLLEELETQAQLYGIAGTRNVAPDHWLEEDDTVTAGGIPFEVLHCPGHTPGHIVFVQREARLALVGDVLFAGSVGRTDFQRSDPTALIRSIKEKLFPLGDDVAFICGHGPTSTIGRERASNPFLV